MTSVVTQDCPPSTPALPDYVQDQNAVLGDTWASWRYGQPPDYTNTRKVFEQTKSRSHPPGSLPDLVQNLVKNWEIEASFKTKIEDWRTIDPKTYTFSINGGPPQSADHMLKVGTYNAIIASNEYYSPKNSDFASSHKTFKRMMPTFAWEVLEVYSGPPVVILKWRHWGTMKNDYVGYNDKGERVTAAAHGGPIDIQGVTVAHVDEGLRILKLETWFDPLEMFRQIAPKGIVNKEITTEPLLEVPGPKAIDEGTQSVFPSGYPDLRRLVTDLSTAVDALKFGLNMSPSPMTSSSSSCPSPSSSTAQSWITFPTEHDAEVKDKASGASPGDIAEPEEKSVSESGAATESSVGDQETKLAREEMSETAGLKCPFFNKE